MLHNGLVYDLWRSSRPAFGRGVSALWQRRKSWQQACLRENQQGRRRSYVFIRRHQITIICENSNSINHLRHKLYALLAFRYFCFSRSKLLLIITRVCIKKSFKSFSSRLTKSLFTLCIANKFSN